MEELRRFKEYYHGSVAIVAALGTSLNELPQPIDQVNIITFGVSDINRLFPVRYQVITDSLRLDDDYGDPMIHERHNWIKKSGCDTMFVKKHLQGYERKNEVLIQTEQLITSEPDAILRNHKLWSHQLSFVTAFSLAVYMGCKIIGLIGFDLTGGYAFGEQCKHYWIDDKIFIDQMNNALSEVRHWCRQENIVVLNLSDISRLEVFEKIKPQEFLNMARDYLYALEH